MHTEQRRDLPGSDATEFHLLYQPIFHINVGIKRLVVVDDFPPLDQQLLALSGKKKLHVGFLPVDAVHGEMWGWELQAPLSASH